MTDKKVVVDKVVAAGDGTWGPCTHINILTGIEAVRKRPGMYIGPEREANAIALQAIRFAYNFSGVELRVHQNEHEGDWVDVSFDMDPEKLKFELPERLEGYETTQGSEDFRKLCYLVTSMLVPCTFFDDIQCMPWVAMGLSAVFELSYYGTDHIELMRWEKGDATPSITYSYDTETGLGVRHVGYAAIYAGGKGDGRVHLRFTPDMELARVGIQEDSLREEMRKLTVEGLRKLGE